MVKHPELGCYALAGGAASTKPVVEEARAAEALGLGAIWISERWNVKEAAVQSGAIGAVTDSIMVGTAATHSTTRHPMVSAAYGATMHSLTDGRFIFGIGRGVPAMFDAFGLDPITTAQMEDWAGVMKRLWHGETIVGHDGPMGKYPLLKLDDRFDMDVQLGITAFGPNTLALGGRAFDHVILHTFFTDETLARCVKTVKDAAEQAGRDPGKVMVWSVFATIPDTLPEDVQLMKMVGRLATYMQLYGELMRKTNNWDPADLERFRAADIVKSFGSKWIDQVATAEQLEQVAEVIPDEWLAPAATGSPERQAAAVRHQLDVGADGVICHGVSPADLGPLVEAYSIDLGKSQE